MGFKVQCDVRFQINDGAIICLITPNVTDMKIIEAQDIIDRMYGYLPILELKTYKGIARFKEGDTNDIKMGMEIARKKAMRQMYKAYRNYMLSIYDKINFWQDDFFDHIGDVTEKANQMTKEIKELTEE